MKKMILLAGVAALIFALSCKHDPFPVPGKVVIKDTTTHKDTTHHHGTSNCSKDTVYFSNTILPLIISSCASPGCHDANSQQGGYVLTSYSGIMGMVRPGNPTGSRLYNILFSTDDKMPPNSSLTAAQEAEISTWIQQGAKQNKCTDSSGCDSINVKYTANIQPILSANCIGCHNAGLASGGVALDSYTGVQIVANNGQLVKGVTGVLSRMPKYGNPLSVCDIGMIRKWVNDGAPNN